MNDTTERDTEPAPPPHLVCSVCGGVVEQRRSSEGFTHAAPVCPHWRALRAVAIEPELFEDQCLKNNPTRS